MTTIPNDAVAIPPAAPVVVPSDAVTISPAQPETFLGAMKSLLTGAVRGVPEGYGIIGDAGNAADLGWGDLTGNQALADKGSAGLAGKNGFDLGTNSISKYLDDAGILDYKPTTPMDKSLYDVAHFGGSVVGTGGIKLVAKLIQEGAIPAAIATAKYFGIGLGGGAGAEAGRQTADAIDAGPWTRFGLEGGGSLLGGLMGGKIINSTEATPSAQAIKALGGSPRFASDINEKTGLFGKLTSDFLPSRVGAQGASSDAAKGLQDEISKSVQEALRPDWMGAGSIQSQGQNIQSLANQAILDLRAETTGAFKKLDALIPPTSPVATTDTTQAIGNLVNRATDPDIKAIVSNPTFTKYAQLLNKPNLSWNDMQILRSEIGASMDGADGTELGLLKQIYKGVTSDMQRTAQQTPGAGDAFNNAMSTAQKNGEFTGGVLRDIVNKPNPETVPGYLTNQGKQGATRLQSFQDAVPGLSNQDKADIGRQLLGNQAKGADGQFSLPGLMSYWNPASREMRALLAAHPELQETMDNAQQAYAATAKSRALIDAKPGFDPLALTGVAPLVTYGAAKVAQMPALVSHFGRQAAPGSVGPMSAIAPAIPSNTFPDIYHPPEPPPAPAGPPPGTDAQSWLLNTDRPTAVAFIGSRLGPTVARQIPSDDSGYRAALFSLSSDPQYRKAMTIGSPVE